MRSLLHRQSNVTIIRHLVFLTFPLHIVYDVLCENNRVKKFRNFITFAANRILAGYLFAVFNFVKSPRNTFKKSQAQRSEFKLFVFVNYYTLYRMDQVIPIINKYYIATASSNKF